MKINLPGDVQYIITMLEDSGFEAYAVGGCIRDSLMGKEPKDWDVCTSALPEQMTDVFINERVIETGIKHGTITILINDSPYECTTYRVDGKYTDNRHPDRVKFVDVLKRDLARRDFTINAMAYNPKTGLVDYYTGQQDLENGKIKCVGNPNKRFKEDALRIMRALRFASEIGLTINNDTAQAMVDNKGLLNNISVERIAAELDRFILGESADVLMMNHQEVFTEVIPELSPTIQFEQNTPYHCYDVFTHTIKSVKSAPPDVKIKLAMLLHDIGKPSCYTEDENGVGHFYGHAAVSAEMAEQVLKRLKYDNDTIDIVKKVVLYDVAEVVPSSKNIKLWLNRIGEERCRQLLQVIKADAMAQAYEHGMQKEIILEKIHVMLDDILEQQQCFSLKDLAVNGRDMMELGIAEGKQIGLTLSKLMDMVIDEEIENERDALLEKARELQETKHCVMQ